MLRTTVIALLLASMILASVAGVMGCKGSTNETSGEPDAFGTPNEAAPAQDASAEPDTGAPDEY